MSHRGLQINELKPLDGETTAVDPGQDKNHTDLSEPTLANVAKHPGVNFPFSENGNNHFGLPLCTSRGRRGDVSADAARPVASCGVSIKSHHAWKASVLGQPRVGQVDELLRLFTLQL